MKPTQYWQWMIRDELTGKMRRTRHRMGGATLSEAVKAPGSCEIRNRPETHDEHWCGTTSNFQRKP
jgi:hypothetical protein